MKSLVRVSGLQSWRASSPLLPRTEAVVCRHQLSVWLEKAFPCGGARTPWLRFKDAHELPGSVLSKSRGGEKVKQTFNAASHEPQSGGSKETLFTDLGFCKTH